MFNCEYCTIYSTDLLNLFNKKKNKYLIFRTIDEERTQQAVSEKRLAQFNKDGKRFQADFNHFWTTHEINDYLSYLATYHSDICSTEILGHSSEGQLIRALKISVLGRGQITGQRPVIFVDGGIHGREWISHMTAVYLANALVEQHAVSQQLLQSVDFIILPNVNPDGYDYSRARVRTI